MNYWFWVKFELWARWEGCARIVCYDQYLFNVSYFYVNMLRWYQRSAYRYWDIFINMEESAKIALIWKPADQFPHFFISVLIDLPLRSLDRTACFSCLTFLHEAAYHPCLKCLTISLNFRFLKLWPLERVKNNWFLVLFVGEVIQNSADRYFIAGVDSILGGV